MKLLHQPLALPDEGITIRFINTHHAAKHDKRVKPVRAFGHIAFRACCHVAAVNRVDLCGRGPLLCRFIQQHTGR